MKRSLVIYLLLIFLCLSSNVNAVEPSQTSVCGKSYMLVVGYELYILSFNYSPMAPDCYGVMTFYWSNQSKTYNFTTQDQIFVDVDNFATLVLRGKLLYYIDPNGIILSQY